jgi:hypothetical protein
MTALLYYSISSDLTEDEIIEIEKQVSKTRETVCIFVRNLASNAKDKTRKVIVVSILGGALWFSNVQPSEAMGLSIAPTPVVRIRPSYQHDSKVQIAKIIRIKRSYCL